MPSGATGAVEDQTPGAVLLTRGHEAYLLLQDLDGCRLENSAAAAATTIIASPRARFSSCPAAAAVAGAFACARRAAVCSLQAAALPVH